MYRVGEGVGSQNQGMYKVGEGAGSQNQGMYRVGEGVGNQKQGGCILCVGRVRLRKRLFTGEVCRIWSVYIVGVDHSSTGATEI